MHIRDWSHPARCKAHDIPGTRSWALAQAHSLARLLTSRDDGDLCRVVDGLVGHLPHVDNALALQLPSQYRPVDRDRAWTPEWGQYHATKNCPGVRYMTGPGGPRALDLRIVRRDGLGQAEPGRPKPRRIGFDRHGFAPSMTVRRAPWGRHRARADALAHPGRARCGPACRPDIADWPCGPGPLDDVRPCGARYPALAPTRACRYAGS